MCFFTDGCVSGEKSEPFFRVIAAVKAQTDEQCKNLKIVNEKNPEVLKAYLRKASAAQSMEEAGKLIQG